VGDPKLSIKSPLVPFLGAVASASIAVLLYPYAAAGPLTLGIWAVLLAESGLVKVPAGSGNRLSLAFIIGAAMPILLVDGTQPDLASTGLVYAAGLLVLGVARVIRGDGLEHVHADVMRLGVGLGVYAVTYAAIADILVTGGGLAWVDAPWDRLIAFVGAGAVWFIVEAGLWAIMTTRERGLSWRYLWLLGLGDWMVMLSMMATGALFGFSWEKLHIWAVLVAALPYGFAHVAFFRYLEARRTYGQTIRALSRIPEVAGLALEGHSDRTSSLAVETAQDLGLTPGEVTDVRYAALMHDIGRITLNEPSILRRGFTDEDIARWGAEIVAESPYLATVAGLVARQHEPYRRPGEQRDPSLPTASKIIKAASAYDHATMELGFSPLEGLEVLHRGAAYDYDPDVVVAVRRVLERRGAV
jgi:hypothetical protein